MKERIVKDEDIMNLINEIKLFQKQIVRNGNDSNLEDKINDNLTKLNNYPIYVRFDELQKELNSLFQTIKFSIEDCVNDITN
ncbi:MAG: YlbF family regulator [bacterium]|nr:YlbF family regulator [bacterium]